MLSSLWTRLAKKFGFWFKLLIVSAFGHLFCAFLLFFVYMGQKSPINIDINNSVLRSGAPIVFMNVETGAGVALNGYKRGSGHNGSNKRIFKGKNIAGKDIGSSIKKEKSVNLSEQENKAKNRFIKKSGCAKSKNKKDIRISKMLARKKKLEEKKRKMLEQKELEKKKLEKLAKERLEREKKQALEKKELEAKEAKKKEALEKKEREVKEVKKKEKEKRELELNKLKQDKIKKEKLEKELLEKEKFEKDRLEREKLEQQKLLKEKAKLDKNSAEKNNVAENSNLKNNDKQKNFKQDETKSQEKVEKQAESRDFDFDTINVSARDIKQINQDEKYSGQGYADQMNSQGYGDQTDCQGFPDGAICLNQEGQEGEKIINEIILEVAKHWRPPEGLKKDLSCTIGLVVDWNGKVTQVRVVKPSGVLAYDISARVAASKLNMPNSLYGKDLNIGFTQ